MMTSLALKPIARAMATICCVAVLKRSSGLRTSILILKRASSARASSCIAFQSSRPKRRFSRPEADILGDRAIGDQVDFLIDRADALVLGILRRARLERRAVKQ